MVGPAGTACECLLPCDMPWAWEPALLGAWMGSLLEGGGSWGQWGWQPAWMEPYVSPGTGATAGPLFRRKRLGGPEFEDSSQSCSFSRDGRTAQAWHLGFL